jgi:hypothetical protein
MFYYINVIYIMSQTRKHRQTKSKSNGMHKRKDRKSRRMKGGVFDLLSFLGLKSKDPNADVNTTADPNTTTVNNVPPPGPPQNPPQSGGKQRRRRHSRSKK